MEILMERYMRESVLKERPLHQNQHEYQLGKAIETALHNVVTRIEGANKCKEIALGALLNIQEAFDVITQAAESLCWKAETLSGETMRASAARRCPQ
jgi:hypothetical protein